MSPPIIQTKSIADNVPVNTAINRAAVWVILGPMYISTSIALLGVIAIMVLIAPKFEAVIKDFDIKLSPSQALYYSIADAVGGTQGRFPLWPILAPGVIAIMFGLAMAIIAPATRKFARVGLFLLFLFTAVLVVLTIVSCFAPLATLMNSIAADPARSV